MNDIMEKLQAPFPSEDIEWRVQREVSNGAKVVVLAYVTNRAIMQRLDEVFGPTGWQNDYREWRDKGILCSISANVDGQWVTKHDGADTTQVEGTKGGFSGSMKRAAVQWGIGRYLYKLEGAFADLKDRGQHYHKTKQGAKYWDSPKLPTWALPKSANQSNSQPATQPTKPVNQPSNLATDDQQQKIIEMVNVLADMRNVEPAAFYKQLNITKVSDLKKEQAVEVMNTLRKWHTQAVAQK